MRARRGSAYVLVLGTTAIVSAVTLGASLALPAERRSAEWAASAARARTAAASALELGMHLASRSDFRTNYAEAKTHTVAGARVTIQAFAPDGGRVSSDPSTDVLLRTVATAGQSVQTMEVLLKAQTRPMTSLYTAVAAGDSITIDTADMSAQAPVIANNILTLKTRLNADAGAGVACLGATYQKAQQVGITVEMPGLELIEAYRSRATSIPYPASNRRIEKVLLSPASNPFGAPNAEGIYVIDCGAMPIDIRSLRIHGTLILINPGVGSKIDREVHWTTPHPSQPALLVLGSIALDQSIGFLKESSENVNFNPSGTPYEGSTDFDKFDQYPSIIKGLVFALLDLNVTEKIDFEGTLMAGRNLTINRDFFPTYNSAIIQTPPDTMHAWTLTPDGQSWKAASK